LKEVQKKDSCRKDRKDRRIEQERERAKKEFEALAPTF
jgi:hypothetical protein